MFIQWNRIEKIKIYKMGWWGGQPFVIIGFYPDNKEIRINTNLDNKDIPCLKRLIEKFGVSVEIK